MDIFEYVAQIHNKTSDEVKKEMAIAVQEGFCNPKAEAQAMRKQLFPDGKMPTVEEFIHAIAEEVKRRQ